MAYLHHLTQSKHFKKIVIASFFIISALLWGGLWLYGQYYVGTEDAYINANVVQIAPRVTGKIIHVYTLNNQYVQKGQLLFDIDPAPFQAAVDSARAQVDINTAQLAKAALSAKRTMALVKTKYLSPQEGDNTVANLKTAMGNVQFAKASLVQAELNLQYTRITAPASGFITNMNLRAGDVVMANQPLFALVDNELFWADANFKETEMAGIKPGQRATVVTDLYPHHRFNAIVESISSGAGAAFSLLPPQNATGNWVKVTQRIPVRVRILNPDANYPLRIGISATVTVHLKKPLQQA